MATKKPTLHSSAPQSNLWTNVKEFISRYQTVFTLLAIGFFGGFLWLAGMRLMLVETPETHYHANFAVYINGVKEEFKDFTYYEEVAACTSVYSNNPKGRVHMHDKRNDVLHVHDKRVTYGNFFQNIGWNIGDEFIETKDKLYLTDADNKVTYILNGEVVDTVANQPISNLDHLLVSYGPAGTDFAAQYDTISTTAAEVNKYQDPATCGGLNGDGFDSFGSRIKRATFW